MGLTAGTRLGPYDIVAPLGAGGMGEVYRARDTKLDRDVAIKMLPEAFAGDPERVARFRREAKTLASLNHPHIGAIHGLEEADGVIGLVLELVEGETLAERIARGAIPVDEAIAIAKQIAEALEAAHEHGIIHRDLKPANIKVTPDGVVKVLDFGLAKALGAPGEESAVDAAALTQSPTLSLAATHAGVILGTAAYMAPEQAKGRPADRRSDLWAFGCVLYEMLAGKRAFEGEDLTDVLGAVVRLDPDWTALPAGVPAPVRLLLRTCLTKDARKRRIDAPGALFVLDHVATLTETPTPDVIRRPRWRTAALVGGAFLAGGSVIGAPVWWMTRAAPLPVTRTEIVAAGDASLSVLANDRNIAITPDGTRVVYRGSGGLLVRSLDRLLPDAIVGVGAPRGLFTSPDGDWIGFFDGTRYLKKVAVTGGPAVTIAAVDGTGPRGAAWGDDGTILFATSGPATGLMRVSAAGGEPEVLTKPDRDRGEADHILPEFLPGAEAALFTVTAVGAAQGSQNDHIAVLDLRTGEYKIVLRGGSHAHYLATGHLLYAAAGTLRAVRFDADRHEVIGAPVPVVEGVMMGTTAAADFGVASNGTLVYIPGAAGGGAQQRVVSVDREGRISPLPGVPVDSYRDARVSPDGSRVALATQSDVWIYDFARATLSRLTTDPGADRSPLWTPDGDRIVFTSTRAGYSELFWRASDGTGSDDRLITRGKELIDLIASGWSPDGTQMLFAEVSQTTQCTIAQSPVAHAADPRVLVKNDFCSLHPTVSPDGRWLAYQSNLSGRAEIYVERYPELGGHQQISAEGGRAPLWSRDGKILYFRRPDDRAVMAVSMDPAATFRAGQPEVLFELPMTASQAGWRTYDLTPDGRFIVIQNAAQVEQGAAAAAGLVVVQNWFEELKRLVPTN